MKRLRVLTLSLGALTLLMTAVPAKAAIDVSVEIQGERRSDPAPAPEEPEAKNIADRLPFTGVNALELAGLAAALVLGGFGLKKLGGTTQVSKIRPITQPRSR